MKFNIDIKELYQEFKKEYNLINAFGYIPRYSDAVKAFDNFVEEDSDDIVCDFVSYCHDISNDFEAAAFMFAMENLADNFDLDKYLDKNP